MNQADQSLKASDSVVKQEIPWVPCQNRNFADFGALFHATENNGL